MYPPLIMADLMASRMWGDLSAKVLIVSRCRGHLEPHFITPHTQHPVSQHSLHSTGPQRTTFLSGVSENPVNMPWCTRSRLESARCQHRADSSLLLVHHAMFTVSNTLVLKTLCFQSHHRYHHHFVYLSLSVAIPLPENESRFHNL